MFLEIANLQKSYPDGWSLKGVSFSLGEREILCLLGPSGCGKTTLLRLIAGLETPDSGQILLDGQDVTAVPPHRRPFGLMFQEYALFPHKNVFDNVAFGLRMAGWPRPAIRARVEEMLELVGLAGFARRDVNLLSGGEQQRVALARSLAPQPRLLLLDEPLGALDRALRERLLSELPALLRQVGVTAITVTHDQEEAFALADRLVVMRDGEVIQQGSPEVVYRCPASVEVARFLGLTNLLPAHPTGDGAVETPLGRLQVDIPPARGQTVLLIRPEAIRPAGAGVNQVEGTVIERAFRGGVYRLTWRISDGVELTGDWPSGQPAPAVGERTSLTLDPAGLVMLEGDLAR